MSKHRGGKDDFAEHPAKAKDEVKKGVKKAEVISPIIIMFLSIQARTAVNNNMAMKTNATVWARECP
ncbi:hypothetical protein [Candidatus Pantoea bituminis]|uniref:hypothetical protein n=1 Tax=Candidatus Pantoea bituminis TaxID=2831036 RepID=UPI001C063D17|nr:hypothetical protein [Pantoea bituminis]